jgi:hypothetical protein
MAGPLTAQAVTLGDSATDTNNFRLRSNADGTLTLARGANGALGSVLTVDANGNPLFSQARTVAQIQTFQTSAVATGTTQIPVDDTIPQITEGDQYMTLTITPKNASSTLVIDVHAMLNASAATTISGAIFQDSTANAIAATAFFSSTTNAVCPFSFRHIMTAGTTSATTFRFRAGPSGAVTLTFNGSSGARIFGGVASSRITITEYLP